MFIKPVHVGRVFQDSGKHFADLIAERCLVVEQRLDVSGDGGERGAEFVGDVGYEVALGALDLLDAGDVVQDGDGATAGHGRSVDLEDASGHKGGGAAFADDPLFERGADALGKAG